MKTGYVRPILTVFALALIFYAATYFATVRFSAPIHAGGFWFGTPFYAGVPQPCYRSVHSIFGPLHALDRKVLRPSKWAGRDSAGYPPEYTRNMPWW